MYSLQPCGARPMAGSIDASWAERDLGDLRSLQGAPPGGLEFPRSSGGANALTNVAVRVSTQAGTYSLGVDRVRPAHHARHPEFGEPEVDRAMRPGPRRSGVGAVTCALRVGISHGARERVARIPSLRQRVRTTWLPPGGAAWTL